MDCAASLTAWLMKAGSTTSRHHTPGDLLSLLLARGQAAGLSWGWGRGRRRDQAALGLVPQALRTAQPPCLRGHTGEMKSTLPLAGPLLHSSFPLVPVARVYIHPLPFPENLGVCRLSLSHARITSSQLDRKPLEKGQDND